MKSTLLLIEDDPNARAGIAEILGEAGHEITAVATIAAAREAARTRDFDLILSDIRLPDGDGRDLALELKRADPERPIVLMTAYASVRDAVEALRQGIDSYLTKPLDFDEVRVTLKRLLEHRRLRRENRRLRAAAGADYGFEGLIGASAPWLAARRLAEAAAATEAAILLTGESGTGKELAARAIHAASPRAAGPFVALNCAAVPRDLLESELFGHEPGAFTGAVKRRIGRLELADNGTLLLDEIGDMAVELQAKLLRVLEEKSVLRLGGVKPVRADFRVVAATNRDLRALIGEGRFREDLFYRLNVLAVRLPPLRERPGDIALLLDHFLRRGAASRGAPPPIVTAPIMRMIEEHGWPGNVRELISFTERILLLTDGEEVTEGIVEAALGGETRPAPRRPTAGTATATLPDAVRDLEERLVREALEAEAGNRTNAARRLGISLRALQYRLKAFEIES